MAHLENLKFWRGAKAKAEISFYDCEDARGQVHPERASHAPAYRLASVFSRPNGLQRTDKGQWLVG